MESVLQLYGLAMVVLPVYAFVSLRKRIRLEYLAKSVALLRYAGLVIAPVVGYVCVFALALGVEEVMHFDLISEEAVRSFALAVVLGMLVWFVGIAVFSLGLLFVEAVENPNAQKQ